MGVIHWIGCLVITQHTRNTWTNSTAGFLAKNTTAAVKFTRIGNNCKKIKYLPSICRYIVGSSFYYMVDFYCTTKSNIVYLFTPGKGMNWESFIFSLSLLALIFMSWLYDYYSSFKRITRQFICLSDIEILYHITTCPKCSIDFYYSTEVVFVQSYKKLRTHHHIADDKTPICIV